MAKGLMYKIAKKQIVCVNYNARTGRVTRASEEDVTFEAVQCVKDYIKFACEDNMITMGDENGKPLYRLKLELLD